MHSSKFIQIRKERSVEQRLASIWLDACSELEIPCILVYQSHWSAYISLNLKFIPESFASNLDPESLREQLAQIHLKYSTAPSGYCQHNQHYHTFDAIPVQFATQAATEIFDAIMSQANYQPAIKLEERQVMV